MVHLKRVSLADGAGPSGDGVPSGARAAARAALARGELTPAATRKLLADGLLTVDDLHDLGGDVDDLDDDLISIEAQAELNAATLIAAEQPDHASSYGLSFDELMKARQHPRFEAQVAVERRRLTLRWMPTRAAWRQRRPERRPRRRTRPGGRARARSPGRRSESDPEQPVVARAAW